MKHNARPTSPRARRTQSQRQLRKNKSVERRTLFEPLEPRLVLTASLRPGPVPDDVVLFPDSQTGVYQVAADPIDASNMAMIDLSVVTDDDQRYEVSPQAGPLVKVDTNERYAISLRTFNSAPEFVPNILNVDSFDIDKEPIEAVHVTKHAFSKDTTLAAALNPGDTSLLIENASGWSNSAIESAETRALAWYGYTDTTGHTYPDYTYTRFVAVDTEDGLWAAGGIRYENASGAYRVSLNQPWNGPTLDAGVAIRNATARKIDVDFRLEDSFVPTRFNSEANYAEFQTFFGGGEWTDGQANVELFLPGTSYVQANFSLPTTDVVISPEQDLAFGNTSDSMRPTVDVGGDNRVRLEFDVLSKGALPSFTPGMAGNFDNDDNLDGNDFLLLQRGLGSTYDAADLTDWQKNYGSVGNVVLASVETPSHGTAQIITNTNGQLAIDYQSASWFVGTDLVRYTLRNDAIGQTFEGAIAVEVLGSNVEQDPAQVAILNSQAQVVDGNEAPEKLYGDLEYVTATGLPIIGDGVRDFDLLEYMRDPVDELIVQLVDGPTHGTLEVNFDGTFEYTPEEGFAGWDTFRYEVFDGLHSTSAVASIQVLQSTDALLEHRMERIARAMLNYESARRRFPVASNFDSNGIPYLSWRVHILPFLGYQSLHSQFNLDEPWNSANNLPLLNQMPDLFRSIGDAVNSTTTRFQTFTGPDAPFGRQANGANQLGPSLSQFRDGLANTLLIAVSGSTNVVTWTKPDDLEFSSSDPLASLGTIASNEIKATTADGKVITLPSTIDASTFSALVTMSGGEIIDAGTLRRQFADLGSNGEDLQFIQNQQERYRQIALAMLNFESARDQFPSTGPFDVDGNPYLSWRVHILPYLGHSNLYDQFNLDEPWDSANNLPLLELMPDVFRSLDDAADTTDTRIQTLNGPEAAFGFRSEGSDQEGPEIRRIADGTSNTIMFVEGGVDTIVPWTKPEDLPFDLHDPLASLGVLEGEEFLVAMFDGSTRRAPTDISASEFSALVTRDSQDVYEDMQLPSKELQPTKVLTEQSRTSGVFGFGTTSRQNQLKQIVFGMLNFEDSRKRLPANAFAPDGTPLLSWRVLILPLLEQQALYDQFRLDEPWDSPHNLALLEHIPDFYRDLESPADSVTTRFMTFVGDDTPFPVSGDRLFDGRSFSSITDGTSNTLAVVEAGIELAVPWTKPTGLEFYENNPFSVLGQLGINWNVAFIDGHVESLPASTSIEELSAYITHNGGEDFDNLPVHTPSYDYYISQSGGDTVLNEFGVDTFDVVLDRAPASDVEIIFSVNDTSLANVDQQSVIFTPENWHIGQRVAVRGVDNFVINDDQQIQILALVNPLSSDPNFVLNATVRSFNATIVDDDLIPGDFNSNATVDGVDLGIWQASYGLGNGADADRDGDSDGMDFLAWQRNRTVVASASASLALQSEATNARTIDAVLGIVSRPEEAEAEEVLARAILSEAIGHPGVVNKPLTAAAAEWERSEGLLDENQATESSEVPWLSDEILERVFG